MGAQTPDIFMQRVSEMMKRRFISKKDMAERLNVDYSTFWRKLNGKRNVDVSLLMRIAEILGTSAGYLLGETDNPLSIVPYEKDVSEDILQKNRGNIETGERNFDGFAYWGSVLDKAKKVAEHGNIQEMSLIEQLLKSAVDVIVSAKEQEKLVGDFSSDRPVYYGSHHNNIVY